MAGAHHPPIVHFAPGFAPGLTTMAALATDTSSNSPTMRSVGPWAFDVSDSLGGSVFAHHIFGGEAVTRTALRYRLDAKSALSWPTWSGRHRAIGFSDDRRRYARHKVSQCNRRTIGSTSRRQEGQFRRQRNEAAPKAATSVWMLGTSRSRA